MIELLFMNSARRVQLYAPTRSPAPPASAEWSVSDASVGVPLQQRLAASRWRRNSCAFRSPSARSTA